MKCFTCWPGSHPHPRPLPWFFVGRLHPQHHLLPLFLLLPLPFLRYPLALLLCLLPLPFLLCRVVLDLLPLRRRELVPRLLGFRD